MLIVLRSFSALGLRLGLGLLTALASFGLIVSRPTPVAAAGMSVVATTTQVEDWVQNVGGSHITLYGILHGDDDPHDYDPTAADARAVSNANVIFENGVGLETWFAGLEDDVPADARVVALGDSSDLPLLPGDDEDAVGNPHIWFDPTNAELMVLNIRDTLSAVDPANASDYAANADAYNAKLAHLDSDLQADWSSVPADQRKLVTNHDAFGYYVRRYGVTFVGSVIPSLSSQAEPSAADTLDLIQAIQAANVKAIFTENTINPRLAQQISQQAGVKIYSNLYGDSLGQPGSPGETYLKMMRYDTDTMIAGMLGQ